MKRGIATLWRHAYRIQYGIRRFRLRHRRFLFWTVAVVVTVASMLWVSVLQEALERFLVTDGAVAGLRSVILNAGSALIGASAIVSSLVLFAMQVNVERMPFGLFRSLNADFRLVGAFAAAFVLAVGVAGMSMLVERSNLGPVVLAAAWAIFWILFCSGLRICGPWTSSVRCARWRRFCRMSAEN